MKPKIYVRSENSDHTRPCVEKKYIDKKKENPETGTAKEEVEEESFF